MSRLVVLPIVEGHGEDAAIRVLLSRAWREMAGGEFIEILKPIRAKRDKLVKPAELDRLIELGVLKLRAVQSGDHCLVLVLIDADQDCPAQLSSTLLKTAQEKHANTDVVCVIAKVVTVHGFLTDCSCARDLKAL